MKHNESTKMFEALNGIVTVGYVTHVNELDFPTVDTVLPEVH